MFEAAHLALNHQNLEIIMLQQLAELSDDFDALPDVLACYEYEV
jgi:hypothetical protein